MEMMQTIRSAGALFLVPMALAMASFGTVAAQSAPEAALVKRLLAKGTCLACHAVDKKIVGPAYRDVAEKYQEGAKAVDRLAEKIQKGGSGVWGAVPMPPAAGISAAEAKILATWVRAGAPAN